MMIYKSNFCINAYYNFLSFSCIALAFVTHSLYILTLMSSLILEKHFQADGLNEEAVLNTHHIDQIKTPFIF